MSKRQNILPTHTHNIVSSCLYQPMFPLMPSCLLFISFFQPPFSAYRQMGMERNEATLLLPFSLQLTDLEPLLY